MDAASSSVLQAVNGAIIETPTLCTNVIPPAVNASQSLSITCTPPANWRTDIYNGDMFVALRNNPQATSTQICNACYPCCALDNSQNTIITYRAGCISNSDYGNRLLALINAKLTSMPQELQRAIMRIISDDIQSRLMEADRVISSAQNITVSGTGVVQRIRQDIVLNVLSQKIISADILSQLQKVINDYYNAPVIVVPPIVTAPNTTVLTPNIEPITPAFQPSAAPVNTVVPVATPILPPVAVPVPTAVAIPISVAAVATDPETSLASSVNIAALVWFLIAVIVIFCVGIYIKRSKGSFTEVSAPPMNSTVS